MLTEVNTAHVSTSRVPLGCVSQWHSGWDTENMEEQRAVAEILRARAHSMKSCVCTWFPEWFLGQIPEFKFVNV